MTLCCLALFGVFCTMLEDTVAVVFLLDVTVDVTFLLYIGLLCFCGVRGKIFLCQIERTKPTWCLESIWISLWCGVKLMEK